MHDFLEISAVGKAELRDIIDHARALKKSRIGQPNGALDEQQPLRNRIAALIFEKPSTRTRVSFDVGVRQLGGQPIILSGQEIHLGHGETITDTARVLSRYVDIAMIRTFEAKHLNDFASAADIPLVNGLTNSSHPCQVLADIMTFEECRGSIAKKNVAWVGAGSNVCNSFIEAAVQFDFNFIFSGPEHLQPSKKSLEFAVSNGAEFYIESDPAKAVKGADLVVTDVWASMHEDSDDEALIRRSLVPYQVNERLMDLTGDSTLFMHCLPAHRGEEVTSRVLDGEKSVVIDEAENRLHVQKSILKWCVEA